MQYFELICMAYPSFMYKKSNIQPFGRCIHEDHKVFKWSTWWINRSTIINMDKGKKIYYLVWQFGYRRSSYERGYEFLSRTSLTW